MSVSRFAKDNNVYFEFHSSVCFVKSQVDHSILLRGYLGRDGLYQFPLPPLRSHRQPSLHAPSVSVTHKSPSVSTVPTHKFTMFSLWHNRLGHPSVTVLQNVLKCCNLSPLNKISSDFCVACCMGKSHQLPSHSSLNSYTKPLQLVFCDLWGPSHIKSSMGYNYYVSFVDAYSRYTWIYFLKHKSETIHVFKQFKVSAELQLNHKITEIQTDWGGEFRPFSHYLTSLGIHHRLICPHTHHQNGVVERKHRHIVDMGLTLLSQASLPLSFWDHAFHTAVYIINRLPSSAAPYHVPYFTLFHKEIDYHFLKIFGCACFPHTRPYHNNKLQFRSTACTFLGYSPCHKGYKCLDTNGKIFISKDVGFDEHTFPFATQVQPPLLAPSSSRVLPLGIIPSVIVTPTQHATFDTPLVLSPPVSSSFQSHSLDPPVIPPFPVSTSSPESHSLPPVLPLPS